MPQPTEAQLEIMDLLWDHEPLTVREVHERLSERRPVSYTTMLTQMQRMAEAGLLGRDTSARTHTYHTLLKREEVERTLFERLADRAFGGSTVNLALRALGDETPTAEELAELRAWVDRQSQ